MEHAEAALALIPRPLRCVRLPGTFAIAEGTPIYTADVSADALMRAVLAELAPPIEAGDSSIRLMHEPILAGQVEAYRLTIQPSGIVVEATGTPGLLHAIQRIRQLLLDGPELPCCVIEDGPRFSWRGAHVDVARHMPPMLWLHRFIDLIALHGYNSLHLHLTDDQGWRMPIDRYPLLTEIGGWRARTMLRPARDGSPEVFEEERYGGSYTKAELRGLVEFAASRGVGVVPEIEMPGHATAAIAAYPELGNTGAKVEVSGSWAIHDGILNVDDGTLRFMQQVLEEVLDVFPSPFIHIGGDEVPTTQWRESETARARVRSEGLRDESQLYGWFLRRMAGWLRAQDRSTMVWDEALAAKLPADSTGIMAWRGEDAGRAAAGNSHPTVMAPRQFTYFDYYQSRDREREPLAIGGHLPLERVNAFEPLSPAMPVANQRHILGTQFQLWSEYLRTTEAVEYMAFPRACALAEVAWSPPPARDFADFRRRLAVHLKRLDRLGVNYRPLGASE